MATVNYSTTAGGLKLIAVCDHTQNISANTSTVTVTLQLQHGEFYASALSGSYLSVAGNKTAYSKSISWGGGSTTTTLSTKTVTVSHNANGAGSCRIIGTFVLNGSYGSTSIGTMTIDQTLTLPTIPRSSGLTVVSAANTGTSITATITPANSTFKHRLQYKVGATVFHTSEYIPAGTTSYTYEIPHSWFPSTDGGTLVISLYTYNSSGTEIASTYKLVTMTVPASLKPSISSFTASVASGGLNGLYVQGKSSAKLSVVASASAGSSIKSYAFSGANISLSTTNNTATTSVIQAKDTVTYKVKVTDYRNRSVEGTVNIYVYPYSTPTISSVTALRCTSDGTLSDSGTYIKYNINSSYSPVNGNNTRTITVAYSSNGGTSYSDPTTIQAETNTSSSVSGVYGGGVFAIASAYVIKFTIKDKYVTTPPTEVKIASASRPINISKTGKGVAIGGMSTKNEFEVSMNADFNNNVNIDGTATVGSTLTVKGGIDAKQSIYMGGLNGQTGELQVIFSNPTASTYPHKSYLFGGAPNSGTAIGCYDGLNGRTIWTYNDSTNVVNMGGSGATISFSGYQLADFVNSYGASADSAGGEWTWRKWKSGRVEATYERALGSLSLTTKSADGVYTGTNSTGTITYPSGLFAKAPLVFSSLQSNGYTHMICASVTNVDCRYRIWSPHSATPSCSFVLYCVGWNL